VKITIILIVIGVIAGGAAGWLYWKHFGCNGSCLITSNPLNSTLYGILMGGILFYATASYFTKNINRKRKR